MLEIKNLSKSFGNQQVLDHISLKIEKGKVIAVIGPSGTGKSTLLRCINVLEIPEEGTISWMINYSIMKNLARQIFRCCVHGHPWFFRIQIYTGIKQHLKILPLH